MSALDPRLVRVEPTGTNPINAFWDGVDDQGNDVGGFRTFDMPVYPASPRGEALAALRKGLGLSLREAGKAIGLSPENLSGIEHRRYAFAVEADWDAAAKALSKLADPSCTCNPLAQTGGGHHGSCPAYEPECTCYEVTGGHQPCCPFGAALAAKRGAR